MGWGRHQTSRPGAYELSRVVRKPAARRDLDGIWDYIARDSVLAADAFVDRIEEKLLVLADNPGLGPERPHLADGVRSFGVGNYILFYQPIVDGIRLVRVMHTARDLSEALRRR